MTAGQWQPGELIARGPQQTTWLAYTANGDTYAAAYVAGAIVHGHPGAWTHLNGTEAPTAVPPAALAALAAMAPDPEFYPPVLPAHRALLDQKPASSTGLRVVPNQPPEPEPVDDEPTGWEAVNLEAAIDGQGPPPPDTFHRTDGIPILYPGQVHAFLGEPESLKSWAWQVAAVQELGAGHNVLVIDFENDPNSVVDRLKALGAKPDQILHYLTYLNPPTPWTVQSAAVLAAILQAADYTLAVIDGVTDAYAALSCDINNNTDAARFDRTLPKPLARTGAATVLVDHVVKDPDGRGRYAIGAQHKLAAITGATFVFDIIHPFGHEKTGAARLTITKDKPGWLRQHAAGKTIAELHLVSWPDHRIDATLQPITTDSGEGFVPTALMERVSRYVEAHPGLSKRAITEAVTGKRDYIILAIELLVTGDYITAQPGPRGAQNHYHNHPYPPADDQHENAQNDPQF